MAPLGILKRNDDGVRFFLFSLNFSFNTKSTDIQQLIQCMDGYGKCPLFHTHSHTPAGRLTNIDRYNNKLKINVFATDLVGCALVAALSLHLVRHKISTQ